jgi:hypothetical protein
MQELVKGQKVYYARIFESVGMFELIDLKIRTVEDTWFVGTEQRTKQAFLFGKDSINKTVFLDRGEALELVIEAQETYKKTHKEKDSMGDDIEETN